MKKQKVWENFTPQSSHPVCVGDMQNSHLHSIWFCLISVWKCQEFILMIIKLMCLMAEGGLRFKSHLRIIIIVNNFLVVIKINVLRLSDSSGCGENDRTHAVKKKKKNFWQCFWWLAIFNLFKVTQPKGNIFNWICIDGIRLYENQPHCIMRLLPCAHKARLRLFYLWNGHIYLQMHNFF